MGPPDPEAQRAEGGARHVREVGQQAGVHGGIVGERLACPEPAPAPSRGTCRPAAARWGRARGCRRGTGLRRRRSRRAVGSPARRAAGSRRRPRERGTSRSCGRSCRPRCSSPPTCERSPVTHVADDVGGPRAGRCRAQEVPVERVHFQSGRGRLHGRGQGLRHHHAPEGAAAHPPVGTRGGEDLPSLRIGLDPAGPSPPRRGRRPRP